MLMGTNSDEHFLDPGIMIKEEPTDSEMLSSTGTASVPIPVRRDAYIRGFPLMEPQSPFQTTNNTVLNMDSIPMLGDNSVWSTRILGLDGDVGGNDTFVYMEDDDIFQVDKADLIQGPTLAELNANDENLLEDLNFDDLLLPEENFSYTNITDTNSKLLTQAYLGNNNNINTGTVGSCPPLGIGFYRDSLERSSVSSSPFDQLTRAQAPAFSPTSQTSSSSSLIQSASSPCAPKTDTTSIKSTLQDLLLKWDTSPDQAVLGHSVPEQYGPIKTNESSLRGQVSAAGLSSSAPTHLGLEQIWQRREPRKHLLSTSSLAEAGSTSSLSTAGVLSPDGHDFSDDADSDEDSDHYEDYSSDGDSDIESDRTTRHSKKERFFWQYNVQAKGPKGQRLIMKCKMEDPHVLNEVTDPVFSPSCSVRGIKHSGKARKGDGNDLTPNPRKLHHIGKELDKLGRIINDMTPVSELPFNVRPKSRKEKNKLASRACRLKKKAQHEANKIKLHGLEIEHKRLITALSQGKQILVAKLNENTAENQRDLTNHMEKLIKSGGKVKIAGSTTDYVNKILDKMKGGTSAAMAIAAAEEL